MTDTSSELQLKYSVNALCVLERTLGRRTVDIIQELEVDGGPAIDTLRAVLAAGLVWKDRMAQFALRSQGMMGMPRLNVEEAGDLIEREGMHRVSLFVGRALGAFLRDMEDQQ